MAVCSFAVLAELRHMREKISLIEAELTSSKESTVDLSSRHPLPVLTTSAADCEIDRLRASLTADNVGHKSAQIDRSVLRPSSPVGSNCFSCTVSEARVSATTGIIVLSVLHHCHPLQ